MVRGEVRPDFWPVARALQRQVRSSGGGAAVCVYHQGEKVADVWAGTRNDAGMAWTEDTMSMSFSTTKGVTSTALHTLVDRGLLDYDDRVAQHWPEFAQNGKEDITVRQLLSHQAGLHDIRNLIDHGERMLDWDHMVEALAAAPPRLEPGSASAYHGLTFGWLVGELVQRVSGKPFSEFVQTELAKPLGLDGLFVGAPKEVQLRAAELSRPRRIPGGARSVREVSRVFGAAARLLRIPIDPEMIADALIPREGADVFWDDRVLGPPIPAVNGLFTARSLARLYAVLAGGGELDGVRLLSEETLERATATQVIRRDKVIPIKMYWRLGYHRVFSRRHKVAEAFGHFGYGSSGAWACPERNLAVAMVNNQVAGGPFGDLRILRVTEAALSCV